MRAILAASATTTALELARASMPCSRCPRRVLLRLKVGDVNDILARTIATDTYEVRGVVATASPSMDIQVSSNFEWLLFDAYKRAPSAAAAVK